MLAPTDAALGQAVVTDPRVPSRVRQGLNVESGLNDGICVPLLLIAIAIAEAEAGAIGNGAAVDSCSRRSATGVSGAWWRDSQPQPWSGWASRAASSTRSGLQVVPVAGAALAYGLAVWMHGSGFIAAFVGGAVFGGLRREVGGEVSFFLEEAGGLLGAVTFILFGAVMLVPMLDDLSVEIVLYALLSLTLVRMVPVALAMLGSGARRPTVAFLGWFGPRGLASIVFAVILVEDADLANESVLLNTIFLTIGLSVLLHGLTATPLAGRYAAWFAAHPREARARVRKRAGSGTAPARLGGQAAGAASGRRRRFNRAGVVMASSGRTAIRAERRGRARGPVPRASGGASLARPAGGGSGRSALGSGDRAGHRPCARRIVARGDRALDRSSPRSRAGGR